VKVNQAFSQLNSDRDKNFMFPVQMLPDPNSGRAKFTQQFPFGAQNGLNIQILIISKIALAKML